MPRTVTIADDAESTKRIDRVYKMSKQEVSTAKDEDPFAQSGEFVKSLSGTTPGFKRKVTNELKKYNRSADGKTESKQIEYAPDVSGYDAFGVMTPPHSLEGLADIYEMSSAHYAAVNAKVDNIVGLGFKLVETAKTKSKMESIQSGSNKLKNVRKALDLHREELLAELEDFNEEKTITEILVEVWRDYEVTGNGYIEIGRKRDGTIGYLGHIPSHTIRVRRQRDGFVQISASKVQFFRNFGDNAPNPIGDDQPNELIHLKRYSPTNAYYGIPDIVAAQQALAGAEFAARYNLEFFENKAVPRHLITLKGAELGSSAQTDLLAFFETGLKGQNHRSMFVPLPADDANSKVEFKIEAVDAKIQESSFNNYDKANTAKILMAHRVPISKVNTAEGASLAIARDADKTFKEQVCGPQQRIFEKKLNRIVKEMTDAYELKLNEMTLTDENTQSQIYERYRKVGVVTGNEVRMALGMATIEGGDELVDMNAKDKIAAQSAEDSAVKERDAARSAASSDNAGEAREPKGEGRAQG